MAAKSRRIVLAYEPDLQLLDEAADKYLVGVTKATGDRKSHAVYDSKILADEDFAKDAVTGPYVILRRVVYADKQAVDEYWKLNIDGGMIHLESMNAVVLGYAAAHPYGDTPCGVYSFDLMLKHAKENLMAQGPVYEDQRKEGSKRAKWVKAGAAASAEEIIDSQMISPSNGPLWPFFLDLELDR